jgi:hypothetical protein
VVLSFLALGALMLALRAAGEQLGWGFQLQSPAVVAVLAALFTLIALNLAGVFEFGSCFPAAWPRWKRGIRSEFLPDRRAGGGDRLALHRAFHGRLAGPGDQPAGGRGAGDLCGAGRGHGPALPGGQLVPAVARALPRPGAWMDTFRS